jgi:hypothetical protein
MCIVLSILNIVLVFTTIKTIQYYKLKRNIRLQHEFRKFIDTETKMIEVAKWIESEKAQKDLGNAFVSDWISKNAEKVREAWNRSKCRNCKKNCKDKLRVDCHDFDKEQF